MGVSDKQVIVFVFFGEKYWDQWLLCADTFGHDWEIVIISDMGVGFYYDNLTIIKVPTPSTVYDMLTFRKRIPEFIDLDEYSQVWYSDPDILFKGDILDKYKHATDVLVSNEPNCSIKHPCMNGWFRSHELDAMEASKAPCINGGFFCVPRQQKDFWVKYRTLCDFMEQLDQNKSTDQFVLNNLYHRKLHDMKLFEAGDVCFRPDETGVYGMVNHYIGMGSEKVEIMKSELNKINAK